ncbi:MAG: hypothetical protein KGI25_04975, partial [Thaumarchaeota archaeon]|nr:hypothetical protein [Nitrososphaerota archaeon]
MYDLLVSSVENLQKSKYSKGNRRNLGYVLGALRQANTLFKPQSISDNMSSLSFRYVKQEDQIPRILEEFITEFEKELPEATTFNVKIYSHFTILALKITRCISDDKRRGLESAHTLEKMNHLFQRYPI